MYLVKNDEKRNDEKRKIPSWSERDGIPARTLPEMNMVGIPAFETNWLLTGQPGFGKTFLTKEIVRKRLSSNPNLKVLMYQVKPFDFSEFMREKDLYICHDNTIYPPHQLFKWNILRELRLVGPEHYEARINEFLSIVYDFYMKSAGSNLYFIDAGKEFNLRYILTLLYCSKENISNDKMIGFLKNGDPKELLKLLAKYPPNHSFLKREFEFNPYKTEKYELTKRGRDIFLFIKILVNTMTGSFCGEGEDTIHDFFYGKSGFERLCICHDEGNKEASLIFEQYFLKRVFNEMLSQSSQFQGDLLCVLDEVDKARVENLGVTKAATLGRQVGDKKMQLLIATQSIESLYSIAENNSDHDARSMFAAFPASAAFNPGADKTTRDILKGMYGQCRRQILTTPLNRYDKTSWDTVMEDYVTDEMFASLDVGQSYLKIFSERPYRVQILK